MAAAQHTTGSPSFLRLPHAAQVYSLYCTIPCARSLRSRRSWLLSFGFFPPGHRVIKVVSLLSGERARNEARAKRVVSACPKDHEKSMPTLLRFDRTCDFDIMTYVRKRRVARGAIVHRLKSKQNIRPPAMSTLLKVCSE